MPTNFNFKELETKNVHAKYRNYVCNGKICSSVLTTDVNHS